MPDELSWVGEFIEDNGVPGAIIIIALGVIFLAIMVFRTWRDSNKVINDLLPRVYRDLTKSQDERDKLQDEVGEILAKLAESDAQNMITTQERDALKAIVTDQGKRIEDLERALVSQKTHYEGLIGNLRAELEQARGDLSRTKEALTTACESLNASEEKRINMETEITAMKQRITELENQIAKYQDDMENLTRMLNDERDLRKAAELERDELKRSIDTRIAEAVALAITPLQQGIARRDEQIAVLQQQLLDATKRATQEQETPVVTLPLTTEPEEKPDGNTDNQTT